MGDETLIGLLYFMPKTHSLLFKRIGATLLDHAWLGVPTIFLVITFIFIHLADTFIQSDLQLLYMSEVARLWSNLSDTLGHLVTLSETLVSHSAFEPGSTPKACVLSTAPSPPPIILAKVVSDMP